MRLVVFRFVSFFLFMEKVIIGILFVEMLVVVSFL